MLEQDMNRRQDEQITYDVNNIVLCFGKALTGKPRNLASEEPELWITLGYFDTLQIYCLPKSKEKDYWVYAMMVEDQRLAGRLDGQFYFHPVHIMSCREKLNLKECREFWNKKSSYLAVTFVQERLSMNDENVNMFHDTIACTLKEAFRTYNGLAWMFYHTLNLSDLVIVWKSNTLNGILEAIQVLYQHPAIGDLHTIPAISFSDIDKQVDLPDINKEYIPRIIARYIVRDANYARKFFQDISNYLPENPFLTTGMEDLSSVMDNVSTVELKNTLYARLKDPKISETFGIAFSETEMHLCMYESGQNVERLQSDTKLERRCEELQRDFVEAGKRILKNSKSYSIDLNWLKVANELYNALLNMSRNAVEDGFCFLILGSAEMFLREINNLRSQNSEQIMQIQRFLRGWGTLMEQSMRMDGKFNQQPGFSPALCHIPSRLLELYLSFNARCCEAIQNMAGDEYDFCFLLVPKLCRRIKVKSIIIQDPPCNRLLYVDIPSDLLYEPEFVLMHLCHEISHFCGENWRLRNKRKVAYLQICARELAYAIHLYSEDTINHIYEYLNMQRYESGLYLDKLKWQSLVCCQEMLENVSVMENLLKDAKNSQSYPLESYKNEMDVLSSRQGILSAMREAPDEPRGGFFYIMNELTELFKECYADISMIYILKLSAEQYLLSSLKEMQLSSCLIEEESRDYFITVERWTIVLFVVYGWDVQAVLRNVTDSILQRFANHILKCMKFLFSSNDEIDEMSNDDINYAMQHYHRRRSIQSLRLYLCNCYNQMLGSEQSEFLELQEAFKSITENQDFSNEVCNRLIRRYRQKLLS